MRVMGITLGDYNEYYRERGRCFKRSRGSGKVQEISFEELLRSHQIAQQLLNEKHHSLGAALDGSALNGANWEARSEAQQIARGFIA